MLGEIDRAWCHQTTPYVKWSTVQVSQGAFQFSSFDGTHLVIFQNELLPPSDRLPAHTKKKPSGPFDRKNLLKHLQEQAETSTVGEDYVPYVKRQPPKETKMVSVGLG